MATAVRRRTQGQPQAQPQPQPAAKPESTGKKTRNVLTWKERNLKQATRAMQWLERLDDELARSSVETTDPGSTKVYLQGIIETLMSTADEWKPAPKTRSALNVGDTITFKDDTAVQNYGFIEAVHERIEGAVVDSVFDKNTVIVMLNDGEKTLIQKRHLQRL
jgi:hypothetical protein